MSELQIKSFLQATDPSSQTDIEKINTFLNYVNSGDFEGASNYLKSNTELYAMNINASRYNQVIDAINTITDYLNNEATDDINTNINRYKDINIYVSTTPYTTGNIVSYNGNLYRCKVANSLNVLPTNKTNWEIFSQNALLISQNENGSDLDLKPGMIWFHEET